jgi:hypothetical protein
MARPPETGPRAGETNRDYWDRLNNERLAREKGEPPAPPPLPAAPVTPAPRVQAPAMPRTEEAREARRRGVVAAINRGEEPEGKPRSVAQALPAATQRAAGLRVERVRILRALVPASLPRETAAALWKARILAAVAQLPNHGVSERCYELVADAILYWERKGKGFAQIGLPGLAKVARYCVRQLQRAINGLEATGMLDVVNVLHREDNEWRRDENIYVPTIDAEPAPLPADVAAADPVLPASVSRALGAGARLAALFGMVLRDGGLNVFAPRGDRVRPAPT